MDFSETTGDVVIVGAGATGLVAALRAHHRGLRPLLIEKSTHIGGASVVSGGGVWMPNSHISQHAGVQDSIPNALKYVETIIDDLEKEGFKWVHSTGYSYYYVEKEGGAVGTTIEGKIFDLKDLGDWQDFMLVRKAAGTFAMYTHEYRFVVNFRRTWEAVFAFLILMGRTMFWKLWGCLPVTLGMSLVAQLLLFVKLRGIDVWRECLMVMLHVEHGKVAGVVDKKDGADKLIRSDRGVMLCAGGFAKNAAMRQKHTKGPVSDKWTSVPHGDFGDAIQADATLKIRCLFLPIDADSLIIQGQEVGGDVALLDDAWWGPTFINPQTGKTHFALVERSLPTSTIVAPDCGRFMNESQSYVDCGHAQYTRHQTVPAIPAWLIFDTQHHTFASGVITKAATLPELADKIEIDAENLVSTVRRFNAMASIGKDEDFNRRDHVYDRYFGDASCKPNPNLPGDLGTKGSLVTDESARVFKDDGTPFQGLYAAGNNSASVMGRTYPGAGGTLGPAMIFAFAAMDHVAGIEET
ncbi:hypothetical protein IFR04_006544 [Cadophora malorum]|uniref:FAD-dependent oxidoreductase 2 FAD-binding domain-containing protein n=1 Tax=Cadophora malorum TaxID=108018 RepID=A0A8H7TKA6_9HELO|nr:hypothetical protein IFR04_006544 [Cadophora malorum]